MTSRLIAPLKARRLAPFNQNCLYEHRQQPHPEQVLGMPAAIDHPMPAGCAVRAAPITWQGLPCSAGISPATVVNC